MSERKRRKLFFVLLLLFFTLRSAHSEESVKFLNEHTHTHTHTHTRGRGSEFSSLGVFFIFVLPALGGKREKKREREIK